MSDRVLTKRPGMSRWSRRCSPASQERARYQASWPVPPQRLAQRNEPPSLWPAKVHPNLRLCSCPPCLRRITSPSQWLLTPAPPQLLHTIELRYRRPHKHGVHALDSGRQSILCQKRQTSLGLCYKCFRYVVKISNDAVSGRRNSRGPSQLH